ncbi:MAG: cadmium-translocating P-type ATPase [Prevotellaceae bacterium]|jgi:Cd2+/Zn2+-exporting ATPase|nr:cadmium-translocating P-type ATPase [Prevotellaceae bacterium]
MHEHTTHKQAYLPALLPIALCIILLSSGMIFRYLNIGFFSGIVEVIWFAVAYLPVGLPVVKEAVEYCSKGDIFTEFLLMAVASIGAFAIGEYPEAVAVMLFYAAGEFFQQLAVNRAQANIQGLIDQRPDTVHVIDGNSNRTVQAKEVVTGSIIQLKPGEKLALDGVLLSAHAPFDTSALTGESKPDNKKQGDAVLAGMINLNTPATIRVTAAYEDSKLSRILQLVQDATAQKAPTELFIRKFAHYYTPSVAGIAVLICVLPLLFVSPYIFSEWLYRGLIFLVISCPCALVISVPLSYFGGIGAASRRGILFKGSNYLDIMASVQHVVMDKTGTLTQGVFKVKEIVIQQGFEQADVLSLVSSLESHSTHPIATAITAYTGKHPDLQVENVEEIAGYGLKGIISGKEILAGNHKLLDCYAIPYRVLPENDSDTLVAIAIDGIFAGYITLGDELKTDALTTIQRLKQCGIRTSMLSGDKDTVVQRVAASLGIDHAYGNLLPEDKVTQMITIKQQRNETVAFVGDGINDAPVIAVSDAGIAMGGLGSDAAIEIADIVIQNDELSGIPVAIHIGKATRRIVWQNIILALGIKFTVLILGATGIANMWEAVFADVGVTFLAILNAMRLLSTSSLHPATQNPTACAPD